MDKFCALLGFILLNANTVATLVHVLQDRAEIQASLAFTFAAALGLLLPGLYRDRNFLYIVGSGIGFATWFIIGVLSI